jgi:2,4-dienoyl-CoA reductase-like NADH-dependent reductase (Old Yellow Enzyme family)
VSTLFTPVTLGAIRAANRILMAPMTRGRATREHVPTSLMATHYAQRASAGLIISEATGISRQGLGWPFAPGIWSTEQIEGWTRVTSAVHARGGKIMCQLWHMGRVVHPSFLGGHLPVSASATTAPTDARTYGGRLPNVQARPLQLGEISSVVHEFVQAARNAIAAGFDGVQLHAGSGYLIDQFMRDGTNQRFDRYGGSIENRLRFLIEIVEAISNAVSPDRVSVRFSPNTITQGAADSDPHLLFTAAAAALSSFGLAFLELREPGPNGIFGITNALPVSSSVRKVFDAPLVLNEDYDLTRAQASVAERKADAISFGRLFISNPDLPERFARTAQLLPDSRAEWYTQGPSGYTDYASLASHGEGSLESSLTSIAKF